jgi:hypothetical protein
VVGNPLVAGLPSLTFLNVKIFYLKISAVYICFFLLANVHPFPLLPVTQNPKWHPIPKQHAPLTRSLDLIQEERKNVARRTRERCALLSNDSETDQDYSVEKSTQTEIPLHEVLVEIHNWHTCLNAFCFCLILLCMNLLYFQWLYTATKLTRA